MTSININFLENRLNKISSKVQQLRHSHDRRSLLLRFIFPVLPRPEAMRKDKKTGDYTDGAIFIYERTKKAAKFLLEPFQRDDLDEK